MANKDVFQGKWNEVKGKVKQAFGKLTDDDIAQINGRRQELLGKLQSRYGYAKEKAEEELVRFEKSSFSASSAREPAAASRKPNNPNVRDNPNPRGDL